MIRCDQVPLLSNLYLQVCICLLFAINHNSCNHTAILEYLSLSAIWSHCCAICISLLSDTALRDMVDAMGSTTATLRGSVRPCWEERDSRSCSTASSLPATASSWCHCNMSHMAQTVCVSKSTKMICVLISGNYITSVLSEQENKYCISVWCLV